jgi:hypothetical protein
MKIEGMWTHKTLSGFRLAFEAVGNADEIAEFERRMRIAVASINVQVSEFNPPPEKKPNPFYKR